MNPSDQSQPGDPEQLRATIQSAERYYESTRARIVVYWDEAAGRYRSGYDGQYKIPNDVVVVRIPK